MPLVVSNIWQPDQEAEKSVRKLIEHPEEATKQDLAPDGAIDLAKRYPDVRRRVISAKFLHDLLVGVPPLHPPHGIRLAHGIVVSGNGNVSADATDARVDISGADILHEVELKGFYFTGAFVFEKTRFRRGLDLSNAVFKGSVIGTYATIGDHFIASGAHFNSASFKLLSVSGPAIIRDATFLGDVDFSDATIGATFSLRSSYFAPGTEAGFERMRVTGAFELREAHVCAQLDASSITVGGDLLAKQSVFDYLPKTLPHPGDPAVDFEAATVGGLASFNGAKIRAPADLALRSSRVGSG